MNLNLVLGALLALALAGGYGLYQRGEANTAFAKLDTANQKIATQDTTITKLNAQRKVDVAQAAQRSKAKAEVAGVVAQVKSEKDQANAKAPAVPASADVLDRLRRLQAAVNGSIQSASELPR